MIFDDRVRALEPFGFTPRQTRFLVTVALHGGYCLRRQYATFAGVRNGKNVADFLETLVARQLARRFTVRADRGGIYHLQARRLYRALGQEDNRNRRQVSAALIARKLMVLDYVLAHPDIEWLATEQDKVDLFAERYRIPLTDLPQRAFPASAPGAASTTRYFIHKLPIGIAADPAVVQFVYLVTDGTGRGLGQFLADHARIFAWLPSWTVVAISPVAAAVASCPAVFAHRRAPVAEPSTLSVDDLRWACLTRQAIDQGAWARLSVADLDRFRRLRDSFRPTAFDALYGEWRARGDAALAGYQSLAKPTRGPSVGHLVTAVLPSDYSQFGSLPGIA